MRVKNYLSNRYFKANLSPAKDMISKKVSYFALNLELKSIRKIFKRGLKMIYTILKKITKQNIKIVPISSNTNQPFY
ncbi:hypothetical protein [Campylobacter fetus]|uniref:hypothetical protein n=1 Tax=Campylobacter fetus TaxID=196 RepID=UPI00073D3019|nr:hypothetical protein [Campylobacter fetus]OCR91839.1 hypothetical protein CFT12S02263_08945 [Campylobacter fetus subsp. testudinum]QQF52830.1 hypothetical protein HHI31_08345 [Campylobacter fetus subsp. venerealis]RUT49891.1 hypothetical protein BWK67_06010 [Campylobacter fetus]RUT50152.1 hypothetical protein BWK51_05990 [Campylobacter fetus]